MVNINMFLFDTAKSVESGMERLAALHGDMSNIQEAINQELAAIAMDVKAHNAISDLFGLGDTIPEPATVTPGPIVFYVLTAHVDYEPPAQVSYHATLKAAQETYREAPNKHFCIDHWSIDRVTILPNGSSTEEECPLT